MSTITYGGQSAMQRQHYSKLLLEYLKPALVYCGEGMKATIPSREGLIANWRRPQKLAVNADPYANTALTEGVPPDADTLAFDSITATVKQFGRYIPVSDLARVVSWHDLWEIARDVLVESAQRTLDTMCRNVLLGSSVVVYAGARTAQANLLTTDKLDTATLLTTRLTLQQALAPRFPDGTYHMKITPIQEDNLRRDTDWKAAQTYVDRDSLLTGSLGKYMGFTFVTTTNPRATTVNTTVKLQEAIAYGPGFYGEVGLEGMGLEYVVKALGSAGTADPLNQVSSVGWKCIYTALIVEAARGCRVESGAA